VSLLQDKKYLLHWLTKPIKGNFMKKLSLIFLIIITLTSCDNTKEYKYIELSLDENLEGDINRVEKDTIIIKAENDSIAYFDAFQKFMISKKVNKEMAAKTKVYSSPLSFKLLDETGKDIAEIVLFEKTDSLRDDITERVMNLKNSFEEREVVIDEPSKIDSAKVKELSQYFSIKKDDFSTTGKTWYIPKSAPTYVNMNGLYLYFQVENGVAGNLRLKFQYTSDDWLFIEKINFAIDGKVYEYIPEKTERDSGNGGEIWEWSDEPINVLEESMIMALANAKTAKMKIIGSQYFDIKPVTKKQILNINRTLQLYKLLGGEI
jgi:hypothetical protein